MRSYPIDATRVRLISMGTAASAMPSWVVLPDGARRPDPNRQDVDANGLAMWRVEVIVPADEDDERDKSGIAEVVIASNDRPDTGAFGDVLTFDGLLFSPGYLNKKTNQITASRWSATGIRRGRAAAPVAA